MSVRNASILSGSTYVAPTGGTAFVFADDGVSIQNGVHLTVPATADYTVRESATLKYKPPSLQPDGTYTRDKKSISYNVPIKLAGDEVRVSNCVIRIEREVHPEMSAAQALEINAKACQLLMDADFALFWSAGSLS